AASCALKRLGSSRQEQCPVSSRPPTPPRAAAPQEHAMILAYRELTSGRITVVPSPICRLPHRLQVTCVTWSSHAYGVPVSGLHWLAHRVLAPLAGANCVWGSPG